jgi:hypothetical protein
MAAAAIPTAARPPMTPPAIAPTCFFGGGVGEGMAELDEEVVVRLVVGDVLEVDVNTAAELPVS